VPPLSTKLTKPTPHKKWLLWSHIPFTRISGTSECNAFRYMCEVDLWLFIAQ